MKKQGSARPRTAIIKSRPPPTDANSDVVFFGKQAEPGQSSSGLDDVESLRKRVKDGQLVLVDSGLTAVPASVWKIDENDQIDFTFNDSNDGQKWWCKEPLTKLLLASNSLTVISPDISSKHPRAHLSSLAFA